MKIITILLLSGGLTASAGGLAQKVTLSQKNVKLEKIFREIRKQTGYVFFYDARVLEGAKSISIHVKDASVEEALKETLQGQSLDFSIEQKTITVVQKPFIEKPIEEMVPVAPVNIITGTVKDEKGGALVGVSVIIKGSNVGTSTDASGRFSIDAKPEDELEFSFVGYQKETLKVANRKNVSVTLKNKEIDNLDDVVVVGYGTQRKEDVTSAVSSVSADEFTEGIARDAAELIKGKVSGLNINQSNGDPRSGSEISLRGITSIYSSTQPLILIDGVPGDLNSVAPEMIKSIDVLKDGSAAAIYGSRGSNGVILITTKRSSGEQKPTITYLGKASIQTIKRLPSIVMDAGQYRKWKEEGIAVEDYGFSTNWFDEVLRNPVNHEQSLLLTGGSNQSNYTASVSYINNQGIIERTYDQMIRTRINVVHRMFNNKLKADINLGTNFEKFYNRGVDNVWSQTIRRNPTDHLKDENGNWQERPWRAYENPMGLLFESNGENKDRELRLNGSLTFSPIRGLDLKILGAHVENLNRGETSDTYKNVTTINEGRNGVATRSNYSQQTELLELTGTYTKSLGEHSINFLAGYSYQEVNVDLSNMGNSGFPTDEFGAKNIGIGNYLKEGKATMSSSFEDYKLIGFFTRLNYNWHNRYFLMGSVRDEGNSRFGADHKWGIFPAFSTGWRISNENFMKNVSSINNLFLRMGYGITGLAPQKSYLSLTTYAFTNYLFNGGKWVQVIEPSQNPNPDLRWERKKELNLGLDISLFNRRVNASIDIYNRNTSDMLWNYSVPSPPYLYNQMLANVGKINNKGIELSISYEVFEGRRENDFQWVTGVNYSGNKNKLISLSDELFELRNDYLETGSTGLPGDISSHRIPIGGPIGNFFGYKAVDIDDNGNWIILNSKDEEISISKATLDDRRVIGNGIPKRYINWNNKMSYKNFDLNINIRSAFDFQILNKLRMMNSNQTYALRFGIHKTMFDKIYDKQQLKGGLNYVDYYIEDGDYVKLDNVTLGYKFPNIKGVSQLRVFVTGQNLITLTKYSGIDPEVSTQGLAPGNDNSGTYPTTRRFIIGASLRL